jgi:Protein of unknown function (DUF3800)
MFAAYLDESGTHDGSDVISVAGYIATTHTWDAFSDEWNEFLKREGLSFFHSVDCAAGQRAFKGMKSQERMRINREAIEIITKYPLVAIGLAVSGPYIRRLHEEWAILRQAKIEMVGYVFCYGKLLFTIGNYMRRIQPNDVITLTLESLPEMAGWVADIFEGEMENDLSFLKRYFACPPEFRPKLGFPPIQAADVLAYEFTLEARRHFNTQQLYRSRFSWKALAYHMDKNKGQLLYMDSPISAHQRWMV